MIKSRPSRIRDYITIIYLVIILFCITLSQKFPKFPQEWPFLYFGIALIGFATFLMGLSLITKSNFKISGGTSLVLYVILISYILMDIIPNFNNYGRNAIILRLILNHIFPITLVYFLKDKPINQIFRLFSISIVIFCLINTIIAWYFQFGGSLVIDGMVYKRNIYYSLRLHGLVGEPTHFGLLAGISTVSLIFLYRQDEMNDQLSSWKRNFYFLTILLFSFSLIVSGTRAAMVSTFFALIIFAYFDQKTSRYLIKLFFVAVLVPFIIFLPLLIENIVQLLSLVRLGSDLAFSDNERIIAMSNAFRSINGFNIIQILFGMGYWKGSNILTSFNQYIEFFKCFGIVWCIGAMIFMINVINKYRFASISKRYISAYPFSIITFTLINCFMYTPLDNMFSIATFAFMFIIATQFLYNNQKEMNINY